VYSALAQATQVADAKDCEVLGLYRDAFEERLPRQSASAMIVLFSFLYISAQG